MLKATHAGNAGATVADVVDYFVGSEEDFSGRAVGIGVPGIRLYYPEHWLTPDCALIPFGMQQPPWLSFSAAVMALRAPKQKANCYPIPTSVYC
ncbi:hypothetical protein ACJX0I_09925 [Enterobacter hormaechei subsp. xiangfangensis]|uniref:hypothetical protein n=1 Tax=Enterobacter hormaechei TaxID=158836 RepID=UPI003DA3EC45